PFLNLRSIDHGRGVFTVRISGTDSTTMALLQAPASLTETVTEGSASVTLNKPLRTVMTGNGDVLLKFRRSDLRGLHAGDATLPVTAARGGAAETATTTVFGPGSHGHHGTHGRHGSHGPPHHHP